MTKTQRLEYGVVLIIIGFLLALLGPASDSRRRPPLLERVWRDRYRYAIAGVVVLAEGLLAASSRIGRRSTQPLDSSPDATEQDRKTRAD